MNARRRCVAARCQGCLAAGAEAALRAAWAAPLPAPSLTRRAVPMLFQKPRQGRGAMEPRLIGGAVTELGWRSSRIGLRCEKSAAVSTFSWEKSLGFMCDSPPLLLDGWRVADCRKALEDAIRCGAGGICQRGRRMTRGT